MENAVLAMTMLSAPDPHLEAVVVFRDGVVMATHFVGSEIVLEEIA